MKRSLVLIFLLLPFISLAQKTVFSGKWVLNLRKTDFKQAPDWLVPKSFVITQKNDTIVIQARVYDNQMVEHYYSEIVPFDGTTSETIIYNRNKRVVSLKWDYGDKSFVLSVRLVKGDGQPDSEFTETWSLENDGKTLVVDRNARLLDDYSITAYYDKK